MGKTKLKLRAYDHRVLDRSVAALVAAGVLPMGKIITGSNIPKQKQK